MLGLGRHSNLIVSESVAIAESVALSEILPVPFLTPFFNGTTNRPCALQLLPVALGMMESSSVTSACMLSRPNGFLVALAASFALGCFRM